MAKQNENKGDKGRFDAPAIVRSACSTAAFLPERCRISWKVMKWVIYNKERNCGDTYTYRFAQVATRVNSRQK